MGSFCAQFSVAPPSPLRRDGACPVLILEVATERVTHASGTSSVSVDVRWGSSSYPYPVRPAGPVEVGTFGQDTKEELLDLKDSVPKVYRPGDHRVGFRGDRLSLEPLHGPVRGWKRVQSCLRGVGRPRVGDWTPLPRRGPEVSRRTASASGGSVVPSGPAPRDPQEAPVPPVEVSRPSVLSLSHCDWYSGCIRVEGLPDR